MGGLYRPFFHNTEKRGNPPLKGAITCEITNLMIQTKFCNSPGSNLLENPKIVANNYQGGVEGGYLIVAHLPSVQSAM